MANGPDRIRSGHLKDLPPVLINTLEKLATRYLSEYKISKQTSKTVLLLERGDSHALYESDQDATISRFYRPKESPLLGSGHESHRQLSLLKYHYQREEEIGQGVTISPQIITATFKNAMRKLERDDMEMKVDVSSKQNGWTGIGDTALLNGTNISECITYVPPMHFLLSSMFKKKLGTS
ncbi:hypothetical protein RB195_015492 [Necator americanus]|uniref:Uncharacterized protein n=1 Tax=Necator americanus TaxID=51031 RepID=A0ABR1E4W8_NECAM